MPLPPVPTGILPMRTSCSLCHQCLRVRICVCFYYVLVGRSGIITLSLVKHIQCSLNDRERERFKERSECVRHRQTRTGQEEEFSAVLLHDGNGSPFIVFCHLARKRSFSPKVRLFSEVKPDHRRTKPSVSPYDPVTNCSVGRTFTLSDKSRVWP